MKEVLLDRLYMDPLCYTLFIGPFHLAGALVGCVVSWPVARAWGRSYWLCARQVLRFSVFLFIAGMVMNTLWGAFVWGKIYWCCDYVVDYSPFFPIMPRVLQQGWMPGYINYGLSLFHLNLIWLLYAALAWILALTACTALHGCRRRRAAS